MIRDIHELTSTTTISDPSYDYNFFEVIHGSFRVDTILYDKAKNLNTLIFTKEISEI
jgi:hypothetical protein